MIKFKHNVKIDRWLPEVWYAVLVSEAVFEEYGYDLIITSGRDGTHKRASAHYSGRAADYRIRHIAGYPDLGHNAPEIQAIVSDLGTALGRYYDVVLESNHIHVEFDPKEGILDDWYEAPALLTWIS